MNDEIKGRLAQDNFLGFGSLDYHLTVVMVRGGQILGEMVG